VREEISRRTVPVALTPALQGDKRTGSDSEGSLGQALWLSSWIAQSCPSAPPKLLHE
jgi:hypothetical protein